MNRQIIGLVGHRKAGKTTVARTLDNMTDFIRVSLAAPLKLGAQDLFGWTDYQLTDPYLKEVTDPIWGLSPRKSLIDLGNWLRSRNEDHFVKLLDKRTRYMGRVIIDDVRFKNEEAWVRSQGGIIVAIKRDGTVAFPDAEPDVEALIARAERTLVNNSPLTAQTLRHIRRTLAPGLVPRRKRPLDGGPRC
jgi:hypothetical protein